MDGRRSVEDAYGRLGEGQAPIHRAAAHAAMRHNLPRCMTHKASFAIRLAAPPDVAFAFFEPVNEMKWDPGWHPRLLGERIEAGLIFFVGDGTDRTTWVLDVYEPASHRIGYVAVGATIATRISIELQADGRDTVATVAYEKTALEETAQRRVEETMALVPEWGPHWESAIDAAIAREAASRG